MYNSLEKILENLLSVFNDTDSSSVLWPLLCKKQTRWVHKQMPPAGSNIDAW